MNTNTVTVNVIASPCGCPPGDVCPDSLGVCPSGYMPDPNNPLCCIPQCAQQSCPAGQKWSSVACQCMYIQATSISAPASYRISNGYSMVFNGLNTLLALGLLGNINSCNNFYGGNNQVGNEGNNQVFNTVSVKFAVLDVNGNAIPNVPLTFINNQLMGHYPFNGNAGNTTGLLSISLSLPTTTDANGNAEIVLDLTYQLESWADKAVFLAYNNVQETALASGNIEVIADNHGTGRVSATLFFQIDGMFCEQWGPSPNPF